MDPLSVAVVYVFLFVRSLGKSTLLNSSWKRKGQNSLHSYIHNILAQAQVKGLIGLEVDNRMVEKLRKLFNFLTYGTNFSQSPMKFFHC